jgi:hypothetical protein
LLLNSKHLTELSNSLIQTSCHIRKLVLRNRKLVHNHKLVRSLSHSSCCACETTSRANHELVCCSTNRKLVLRSRKLVRNRKLVLHIRKLELRNHKLVRSPCRSSCHACGTVSRASHELACCSMNRKLVLRNRKLVLRNRKLVPHIRKLGLRSHKLVRRRNKHRSCYSQKVFRTGGPPKRPLS